MRLGTPPGARPDIRDRNPLVIHEVTDAVFAADVSVVGFNYTCPAGRNALIEYCQFVHHINSTMQLGGLLHTEWSFDPAIGAVQTTRIHTFEGGEGPGTVFFGDLPGGQMTALDRWVISTFFVTPSPSGYFRSTIHGVEYDV